MNIKRIIRQSRNEYISNTLVLIIPEKVFFYLIFLFLESKIQLSMHTEFSRIQSKLELMHQKQVFLFACCRIHNWRSFPLDSPLWLCIEPSSFNIISLFFCKESISFNALRRLTLSIPSSKFIQQYIIGQRFDRCSFVIFIS